ncbi:MAG: arginase family protein [Gemmatimonadaceae bacterium]
MMVVIIQVPYDSGLRDARMGRGPTRLLDLGADRALRGLGHTVTVDSIDSEHASFEGETATTFALQRSLAPRVRDASVAGAFPLVIAGNCMCAVGAIAGLGSTDLGVVWFDAHGDFHTPETTTSGFLDGMALSVSTGRCWSALAATVPGFSPVPERRVVHVGGRDFDGAERTALGESAIGLVGTSRVRRAGVRDALVPALDALASDVRRLYLHIDMDVLDPSEGVANRFAAQGGLVVADVEECIALAAERFPVVAATISAFDPALDPEGDVSRGAFRLMVSLSEANHASAVIRSM